VARGRTAGGAPSPHGRGHACGGHIGGALGRDRNAGLEVDARRRASSDVLTNLGGRVAGRRISAVEGVAPVDRRGGGVSAGVRRLRRRRTDNRRPYPLPVQPECLGIARVAMARVQVPDPAGHGVFVGIAQVATVPEGHGDGGNTLEWPTSLSPAARLMGTAAVAQIDHEPRAFRADDARAGAGVVVEVSRPAAIAVAADQA
jgi:hypothetical protein